MAGRNMSAAMLAEIEKTQLVIFHLLELYFSTPSYATTAHRALTWGGNTYSPLGNWLSFSEVVESADISVNSVNIILSGVNQANLQVALTENFIDARAVIRRGFFDSSAQIIVDPVVIFDGRIDSWTFGEDLDGGESIITWQAASHWVDFDRTAGRRTNNEDQGIYYPGDKGFEFAADPAEFSWGRAS